MTCSIGHILANNDRTTGFRAVTRRGAANARLAPDHALMTPRLADMTSKATTAEHAVHRCRFGLSAADVFSLDDSSNINELRLLSNTTWPARAARTTCNMEHMLANDARTTLTSRLW
jgi:hypothetical protein